MSTAVAELNGRFDGVEGVEVEEKGLTVAVHWRGHQDHVAAGRLVGRVMDDVAARTGLQCEPGKLVLELRPPVKHDKGTAVRELVEQMPGAFPVYVGDDLGDLPAFRATRALGGLCVLVMQHEETPWPLVEETDVHLPSVEEFGQLVADVLKRLPMP